MKLLLAPVYFLYKLWVGLIFWLTLFLLFPIFWVLLSREKWFPAAFRWKRRWSWIIRMLIFSPLRVDRRGEIPEGPCVLASNHSSYLDTVFFYGVVPQYFLFVGKGELLNWPLFGLFFRKMDIPVMRQNLRKAYNALVKAYEAIDSGHNVAIYPEGTVPLDSPRLGGFKNGTFKMAIEKQVPIVPITWQTNYLILRDPSLVWEPSLPRISRAVVHRPIETKGMTLEDLPALRKQVFQTIDSAIPDGFRADLVGPDVS